MDTAGSDFPSGDLRVSDAERDRALSELSAAFQVGRITSEEFDERSGLVLAARTGRELTAPLADLPRVTRPAPAPAPPARRPSLTPAQRARSQVGGGAAIVVGLFSALDALGHAVTAGPTAAQREAMRAIMASRGYQVPAGWPPSQGVDWAGAAASAVIAALLIVLGVYLLRRARRA